MSIITYIHVLSITIVLKRTQNFIQNRTKHAALKVSRLAK